MKTRFFIIPSDDNGNYAQDWSNSEAEAIALAKRLYDEFKQDGVHESFRVDVYTGNEGPDDHLDPIMSITVQD